MDSPQEASQTAPPVHFQTEVTFFCEDYDETRSAEVLVRRGEMVLDISSPDPSKRYLVRGKLYSGPLIGTEDLVAYWAGRDELEDAAPADIVARWTLLGDVFVGVWIEDGDEYLFRFGVPPKRGKG